MIAGWGRLPLAALAAHLPTCSPACHHRHHTPARARTNLRSQAAWMADHGVRNTAFASMAKLFAADHCNKVVSDAVQVYGGAGE